MFFGVERTVEGGPLDPKCPEESAGCAIPVVTRRPQEEPPRVSSSGRAKIIRPAAVWSTLVTTTGISRPM